MWTRGVVARGAVRLRTERMLIRPCSESDPVGYADMLKRNHEHIAAYMPDEILLLDSNGVEAFFASQAKAWELGDAFCLVGADLETAEFLTQIYVQPIDRCAGVVEVGYFCDVDKQGCGFVSEALKAVSEFLFDVVGVHKICLVCDDGNEASARVAGRCGFTLEGVLRQHALNKDGSRPDRRFYSRLADDAGSGSVPRPGEFFVAECSASSTDR